MKFCCDTEQILPNFVHFSWHGQKLENMEQIFQVILAKFSKNLLDFYRIQQNSKEIFGLIRGRHCSKLGDIFTGTGAQL